MSGRERKEKRERKEGENEGEERGEEGLSLSKRLDDGPTVKTSFILILQLPTVSTHSFTRFCEEETTRFNPVYLFSILGT